MIIKESAASHLNINRSKKMGNRSYPEEGSSQGKSRFRLIDLFAGAGGMSLGFSESFGHNFEPVWANDFNQYATATYNKNFGAHCIFGDIVDLLEDEKIQIPQADVVIGGPPCQGFSLLNKKRGGDRRKQLWRPFLDVVALSGAQIFVMENVPQLLGSEEHVEIVREAQALGFKLTWANMLGADYGVPQTRQRAFIVGCLFEDPSLVFPPRRTHYKPRAESENVGTLFEPQASYISEPKPWRSIKDEIADLFASGRTEILKYGKYLRLSKVKVIMT